MPKLILLRHGQSTWNLENRFTGWTDVPLTPEGVAEAHLAGRLLRESGILLDVAFTSALTRAIHTLWIVLDELNAAWIPVKRSWRLNERHYGALQGLNKAETTDLLGKDQVFAWRRSYTIAPPPLSRDDPTHPRFDRRYAGADPSLLPSTESLKDTLERVIPYWQERIQPRLERGQTVIVSAHGNSLRALIKYLDHIPDEDIPALYVPTGFPLIYDFSAEMEIMSRRYLGDPAVVQAATEAGKMQALKKG